MERSGRLLLSVIGFLELSPLQNIKDIIGGYGSPTQKVLETVAEFPQRLIPSALGATSRVVDPTARQAFSAGNFGKTQVDQYKVKLPGQSNTLPANVDVWGRDIKKTSNGRATSRAGICFSFYYGDTEHNSR